MTKSFFHPKLDENGKPVALKKPSIPTPLANWNNLDEIGTVLPNGSLPTELNGIPLEEWLDLPQSAEEWSRVDGQVDIDEPSFILPKHKAAAAGVVVQESDGRIWLVSPSNSYGGYASTFPKGRVEQGANRQATAIREAYEESGLKVEITGFLADSDRSLTYTRYYLARRVGGNPASMGWESQAVHLVPRSQLQKFLAHSNDVPLLHAILRLVTWSHARQFLQDHTLNQVSQKQ